jgi:hypothetical protein
MIRLKTIQQVDLDPGFILQVRRFLDLKLSFYPPRSAKAFEILSYQQSAGGFEKFVTRLKRLDYKGFSAITNGGSVYFKAETHPLVIDYPNRTDRPEKYDIGAYAIYCKLDSLLRGDISQFHFIPQRQPTADPNHMYDGWACHFRHLHHKAMYKKEISDLSNPLSYEPHTCWGSFGSVIPEVAADGDLVELYRMLYLFLTIHNPASPLVYIRELSHYERIMP